MTDVLELYIIELPKAKEIDINIEKQLKPWVDFLENPNVMEWNGMDKENKLAIKAAKKVLEEISKDEHERYLAELREKYIKDQKSIQACGYDNGLKQGIEQGLQDGLKRGLEDGLKQGIEQGLQDGLKRGLEDGLKQGIEQGIKQEKIEIAKNMMKQNLSINVIISVTGLTRKEVESLK